MPWIIRLTDTSNHGGAVITAATKWACMDRRIARRGDLLACPIHGVNPIVQSSPKHRCEGERIAREGDMTECDAHLIAQQNKWDMD